MAFQGGLNRQASKRGSTKINILVIFMVLVFVVILSTAILAALIIPKFAGKADDAKIAKARADIATMASLTKQYRLDTDQYPTTSQGLKALHAQPAGVKNWRGPYMGEVPPDPWGHPYIYQKPGPKGEDFLITSYGADGLPGGSGPNADITSNAL